MNTTAREKNCALRLLKAKAAVVFVLFLPVVFTACGRMTPHARTIETIRVTLEPGDYEKAEFVQDEHCVGRYLVFFRLHTPNVMTASQKAMQQAPGANFFGNRHVSMEERIIIPLLYHEVCVVVEGRALRLHTATEVAR